MNEPRRLLITVAHPDDETFGTGSLLAKHAAEGVEVSVVCATRGELGEIAPGSMATPETLPQVREAELRAAAAVMGVSRVEVLGYRDSGMDGSDGNRDPGSFINIPEDVIIASFVSAIRRLKPHVVVTQDPEGGYGHPDHKYVSRTTTAAFHLAGDPAYMSSSGEPPWTPAKLYYWVIPKSFLQAFSQWAKEFNPDWDMANIDVSGMGAAEKDITTRLDTSMYLSVRKAAIAEHRSQAFPVQMLPADVQRLFMEMEHLVRIEPPWNGGQPETDLFSGI
ncbi:MAG: PIG-L family deacetylase [Dehalococcoidia bacterium]